MGKRKRQRESTTVSKRPKEIKLPTVISSDEPVIEKVIISYEWKSNLRKGFDLG